MTKSLRKAATFAVALAVAGSATLVATPAATAAVAPGQFTNPTISGLPAKVTLPSNGSKDIKFAVSFTGTAADTIGYDDNADGASVYYRAYASDYSSPSVTAVSTKVKSYVARPSFYLAPTGSNVVPGTTGGFYLRVYYYTTPGKYQVRFPVTQSYYTSATSTVRTTKWAVATVTVNASSKYSKSQTRATSNRWRTGQTAKFTVRAPEYQRGATVTAYYKAPGAKKYKKLSKGKLKRKSSYSTVTLKKKGPRVGGKIYFKVGKTTYAPAYKTATFKIKRS